MTIYRGGSTVLGANFGYENTITEDMLVDMRPVDGLTELRSLDPYNTRRVYLKYHTTEGDGGNGMFRGVTGAAPATYVDNGGTIIVPTGGNGSAAWLREYEGAVNVKWFGAVGDGSTDDVTAIQAAIDAATNKVVDFGSKSYLVSESIEWPSNTHANFDSATIVFDGDGNDDVITMTAVSNIYWRGKVTIKSNAPSSSNEVYGIESDGLTNFYADHIHFEDLARGFEANNVVDSVIKVVSGDNIQGNIQGAATDAVGSIIVMNGCQRLDIGVIQGDEIYKAAVYLGVSTLGGASTNNEDITIGQINVTLNDAATTANGLGIRSAVRCAIGSVNVVNGYRGVIIQAESGDSVDIKDVSIGQIIVTGADNTTSANGVHVQSLHASKVVERLSIGSIEVKGASEWGVFIDDVTDLRIGSILVDTVSGGSTEEGVRFTDIINGVVGGIIVKDIEGNGVRLIDCDRLSIGRVVGYEVGIGTHSTFDVLRADADCNRCSVESVSGYNESAALSFSKVADVLGSEDVCTIGNTIAENCANSTTVTLNSSAFVRIRQGDLIRSAAPTAGTWAVGDRVVNSAPAAGQPKAWVCTVAGTPGTWTSEGNL